MLTHEQISVYKERLESERKKLITQLAAEEKPEDFGNDVEDEDSQEADEAESMANRLAIAQAFRDRLVEIDSSLAAIASGRYGICTKCGGGISATVLDIVPESQLCENCKKIA